MQEHWERIRGGYRRSHAPGWSKRMHSRTSWGKRLAAPALPRRIDQRWSSQTFHGLAGCVDMVVKDSSGSLEHAAWRCQLRSHRLGTLRRVVAKTLFNLNKVRTERLPPTANRSTWKAPERNSHPQGGLGVLMTPQIQPRRSMLRYSSADCECRWWHGLDGKLWHLHSAMRTHILWGAATPGPSGSKPRWRMW